jgi:transposase InsO family protein
VIEKWRKFYNEKRPHSSLDYQTPKEMREKFEQKQRSLLEKVT